MSRKTLYCIVITIALGGCASAPQQVIKPVTPTAVALDDAQIHSTLIGHKLNNIGKTGLPYTLSFNADGTEIYTLQGFSPETERWTTKDGVICFTSPKIRKECYRLMKDNDDYWLVYPVSGKVHYHYTLTPQ